MSNIYTDYKQSAYFKRLFNYLLKHFISTSNASKASLSVEFTEMQLFLPPIPSSVVGCVGSVGYAGSGGGGGSAATSVVVPM